MNKKRLILSLLILCLAAGAAWAAGSQDSPLALAANTWTDGTFGGNTELWYSFEVTNGNTYSVMWYDMDMDSTKIDIMLDARYREGSYIFTDADYDPPRTFTASRDGIVLLRVFPFFEGETGSYSIRYEETRIAAAPPAQQAQRPATPQPQTPPAPQGARGSQTNPIPLTDNTSAIDAISSSNESGVWFSFSVVNGAFYTLVYGVTSTYSNAQLFIYVDASYQNGPSIFTRGPVAGTTGNWRSFMADRNGTVLVRVYPSNSGRIGNFNMGYFRVNGTQANPIMMSNDSTIEAAITSSTPGGELWFAFAASNGTRYNISWVDADVESGRLDIKVDASYQNGPSIFTDVDSATAGSPRRITANRNGTILLKVTPRSSGRTGSFSITLDGILSF